MFYFQTSAKQDQVGDFMESGFTCQKHIFQSCVLFSVSKAVKNIVYYYASFL